MGWRRNSNKEIVSSADGSANENVAWFWVNRNGFPLDDVTYVRLWRHVCKIHPKGERLAAEIRDSTSLREAPLHLPPVYHRSQSTEEKVEAVQQYLLSLQYNHTGTQFFDIRKDKTISGMVNDAKAMIRECLPIKCLEAVILSIYLTHPIDEIDRFTVGFKTKCGDMVHKHVILAIHHGGRFGALGLSRREELMWKPLVFDSLGELLEEFVSSYKNLLHRVKRITMSQFIPHNMLSFETIQWKNTAIDCRRSISSADLRRDADRHFRKIRSDGFSFTSVPKRAAQPVLTRSNKVSNGTVLSTRLSEPAFNLVKAPVVSLSTGFLGGV